MNTFSQRELIVVMGVSASGKSTLAAALSKMTSWPFVEGDQFHPPANIAKMKGQKPLTNEDRKTWIEQILGAVDARPEPRVILACSALNPTVRGWLSMVRDRRCRWVLLDAPFSAIRKRMEARAGHFMPASLLRSQFDALIPPEDALRYDTSKPVDVTCREILADLREANSEE